MINSNRITEPTHQSLLVPVVEIAEDPPGADGLPDAPDDYCARCRTEQEHHPVIAHPSILSLAPYSVSHAAEQNPEVFAVGFPHIAHASSGT